MAFSVPSFPLACDIYSGPWLTKSLRLNTIPCNLAWGRRVQQNFVAIVPGDDFGANCTLLLPALTDIRDYSNSLDVDLVEVVPGSGRWYAVSSVDDVGKGFSNEYRIATLSKACQASDMILYPGLFWPVPMP